MPLSWVMRDALGQFNVLVAKKGSSEIQGANIRPIARSCNVSPLAPADLGLPDKLSDADVKSALRLLQQFMQTSIVANEIGEACNHLVTLAKQYESIDHNKIQAPVDGKQVAPSTTDKKQTVDDKRDNSVTFLILDTMVSLLSAVLQVDGAGNLHAKRSELFRIDQRATQLPAHTPVQNSITTSTQGPVVSADVNPNAIAQCGNLVPFAFNYLSHIYSSAVRHAACRMLGALSVTFLGPITALLVEKHGSAKKDQGQREFASYQHCVAFLDFRLSPTSQRVTLDYLTHLLELMKNVDRGVLRQEICSSVDSIYTKILAPNPVDPRREAEWAAFQKQDKGVEDWSVLYERMYTQIAKWSSKSKHMLFCYEVLAHMVVFSRQLSFFQNKKRLDIFGELVKAIKKESGDTKKACMRILARFYLHHLPQQFLQAESAEFANQLRVLLPVLLPKKTRPVPDEIPLLQELLVEAGKKNLSVFINEHVMEILQPKSNYYSRQRAIVLAVLSTIATESPARAKEMSTYNAQLGPLVAPYIEDSATQFSAADSAAASAKKGDEGEEDKGLLLLRAALHCFPAIRHPKMEHAQITASAVIMLCKHEDREISGQVSASLASFISLDLNQFFLPTLHTLIDLLKLDKSIDERPDQTLKICNTINLLCNTLAEHIARQNQQADPDAQDAAVLAGAAAAAGGAAAAEQPLQLFQVTPNAWLSLREHVESVVLMRLCHYEGWVRAELLRMLRTFSRPCFRAFESQGPAASPSQSPSRKELADIPFLIDYLLPDLSPDGLPLSSSSATILPTPELFYRPMHDLLVQHYDKFAGVVSYAFSFLHKQLEGLHSQLDQNRAYTAELVNEEWYLFLRNKFLFCALSVRPTTAMGDSVEGVASTGPAAMSAQDLALRFTSSRPRLFGYACKMHEVYLFYENAVSFIQTVPSAQASMSAAQLQAHNTAPASSGLYLVKLNVAKDLSQVRPGGVAAKNKATAVALSSAAGADASASSPEEPVEASPIAAAPTAGAQGIANYVELARHLRKPVYDNEALLAAAAANPAGKKKVKGLDVRGMFYANEFSCHVLAALASQVGAEDYHTEPNSLTQTIDDFIAFWAQLYEGQQLDSVRALPLRTRLHWATLLSRFLFFRTSIDEGKQHAALMSKFDCLRRKVFFFQLLTHLMPSGQEVAQAAVSSNPLVDQSSLANLRALQSAVLGALTQLLSLDAMQDQQLEGQILYFIERILVQHGAAAAAQGGSVASPLPTHLHNGVSQALNTFLRLNAKYVNEFVRMSVSETHAHLEPAETAAREAAAAASAAAANARAGKKKRGSLTLSKDERHLIHREAHPSHRPVSVSVARYYLRALATNWTTNLAYWSSNHGLSLASMLLVAMLAQTSSDPESRAVGLLLAAELEKAHDKAHGQNGKRAASALRLYSHESPFMYIEATLSYSHSLAVRPDYMDSILPILRQAVVLFGFLSPAKKEIIMRLLRPWVHEVTSLLLAREEGHAASGDGLGVVALKEAASDVLTALTDLTRLAYKSSLLNEPIQSLWVTLLSNADLTETIVRTVTQHVLDEYHGLVEAADVQRQAEIEAAMVRPAASAARPAAIRAPSGPTQTPTVLRKPSVQGGTSPTNLANLSRDVTGAPGAAEVDADEEGPGAEEKEGHDAAAAAALVGVQPISLAVDDAVADAASCPSPVRDGSDEAHKSLQVDAELAPADTPISPDAEGASAVHPPAAGHPSSVRSAIDAGGQARLNASIPVFSPVSNAGAQVAQHQYHQAQPHQQAPLTYRSVSKEKALRKLIVTNLLRSPAAPEILTQLIACLRRYEPKSDADSAPLDPDAFVRWVDGRPEMAGGKGQEASGEPLTLAERAAFELLSNAVFENRHSNPALASELARSPIAPASEEDVLTPYYPLLLQNAYVLFHASPEGHEMLVHLALALGLYEQAPSDRSVSTATSSARDRLIASDRFIPLLVRAYPSLRHQWSALALQWAVHSLDTSVSSISFTLWSQLEANSFFFGEKHQEILVQSELQLWLALKRTDLPNLKSIVGTLITPTAYPYDKQGWTSLVAAGWALLVPSSVPVFSLGLSLLQCMFTLPDVAQAEQRRWILSMGRFLCRDSAQEVDTAIVDVLFKGLVSARTFQPTLLLLQSMSEIYSGATLPADNKLLILLLLVNVLHRCMDVERLQELLDKTNADAAVEAPVVPSSVSSISTKHFSFEAAGKGAPVPKPLPSMDPAVERATVRGVDDCVNLSQLVHNYTQSEAGGAGQAQLYRLTTLLKNLALSMARVLPDASNVEAAAAGEDAGAKGAVSSSNANRVNLFKKMIGLVQSTSESAPSAEDDAAAREAAAEIARENPLSNALSPRAAAESLDGVHLPTPATLTSQFMQLFAAFFSSAEDFSFGLSFFTRMLQHAPSEWRPTLLLMLGHFLLESRHYPDAKQFHALAELTTQAFFAGGGGAGAGVLAREAKLAEQTAYLLLDKQPPGDALQRHTDLFNFVRTRASARKPQQSPAAASSGSASLGEVLVTENGRYDPAAELSEALTRIEVHTFPILKQMLGNPREISRPMNAEAARLARQSHVRTASSPATTPPQPARNLPQLQKILSFATLNEFAQISAGASSRSARPAPPAAAPPRPTAAAVAAATAPAARHPMDDSDEEDAKDVPASAAVLVPDAPSSNPFAADDEEDEGEGRPAVLPTPVRHSKAGSVSAAAASGRDSPPAAVPVAIPPRSKPDSDSDDDAALFAAATRRLGGGSKPASRRASASSEFQARGGRDSDDE